jgi:hypothetical protein
MEAGGVGICTRLENKQLIENKQSLETLESLNWAKRWTCGVRKNNHRLKSNQTTEQA